MTRVTSGDDSGSFGDGGAVAITEKLLETLFHESNEINTPTDDGQATVTVTDGGSPPSSGFGDQEFFISLADRPHSGKSPHASPAEETTSGTTADLGENKVPPRDKIFLF